MSLPALPPPPAWVRPVAFTPVEERGPGVDVLAMTSQTYVVQWSPNLRGRYNTATVAAMVMAETDAFTTRKGVDQGGFVEANPNPFVQAVVRPQTSLGSFTLPVTHRVVYTADVLTQVALVGSAYGVSWWNRVTHPGQYPTEPVWACAGVHFVATVWNVHLVWFSH